MTLVACFLTFIVTIVFMFVLRPVALAIGLVDMPGGRKRHGVPVPLIGGICMSLGLIFGTTLIDHPEFWNPAILGVSLLVVVGTVDDRFDLPPNVRLIAQSCAALLVVFASDILVRSLGEPLFFEVSLGLLAVPFTLLFIVTLINAFNLTDGIDGLAGGLALISLGSMAIVGGATEVFALVVLLIAVVSAFLLFNFPMRFIQPVRTFMGDAGSTFLGLSIAAVGIWLSQGNAARISPVIGLWFIAVPVFDFFSTVIRRMLMGKSPLTPDHGHLHHVLTESGLSKTSTLACMLSIAAFCAGIGIFANLMTIPDGFMLLAWLAAGAGYYLLLRRPGVVVAIIGKFTAISGRAKRESV